MHRVFALISLSLLSGVCLAVEPTPAPVPAAAATSKMTLPEGFQATLFAGEPDVVQPIAITFDERGRLWVVECLSYPKWTDDGTGHDRVTILEDTNGDGKHDKRTVFLDNGVNLSGIEIGFGGVWLTSVPQLVFVPDRDRDDRPDGPPEVRLDGFDLKARHNVLNGLVWGPDGWLYGCNGILSKSKVGAPGMPDDQRVVMDCGVWRYHPTRKIVEAVAHGSTNPWGLDFDEYGQAFLTNCVIKHIFHVVPGAHYDRMFGQDVNQHTYSLLPSCADHIHWAGGPWTSSRGGDGAHSDAGGGHAHSGCAVYLGDNFPPEYRNNVFMCNIHGNRLNRDVLEHTGSTYVSHHAKDFLHANDPWFRGIAVKCGPEGGLYATDWTDTGECHNYEVADTSNGRIYRVTYGRPKITPFDLAKKSDAELIAMQFHTNDWFVRQSRRLLQERSTNPQAASRIFSQMLSLRPKNDREAVRRLWALHAIGEKVTVGVDAPEWARFWAVQLAGDQPDAWSAATKKSVEAHAASSTPLIRRALSSVSQRRIRQGLAAEVTPILKTLVTQTADRDDPMLPLLNWYALEPLVALEPQTVLEWLPQIAMPIVRQSVARRLVTLDGGFGRLLAAWKTLPAGEWQLDTLQGVLMTYAGVDKLDMPADWPKAYAALKAHPNPHVVHQAKLLATLFGDQAVLEELRQVAANRQVNSTERLAALEILLARKAKGLPQLLQGLLEEPELRSAAIRGLAAAGGEETPAVLLARYEAVTPTERQEIIHGLTTRPTFALALLNAIDKKSVPRSDVSALVIRQLQTLKHAELEKRLKEVWGEVRPASQVKQELAEKYRGTLTADTLSHAKLAAGKAVFAKNCGNCHKLFGEGGGIGPELTGSQRANLDYVLENVLDPSAIVPFDYRVVSVVLDDGRVLQGIVSGENDVSLTLQTATEKLTVPKKSIESQAHSNVSMMPEGLFERLTADEVRDLVGYLKSPDGRVE